MGENDPRRSAISSLSPRCFALRWLIETCCRLSGTQNSMLDQKLRSMGSQPLPAMRIIWHNPRHFPPEFRGMVMPDQVAKFVNHHVIHHPVRCHHDLPVKFQPALGGAAAPAGFEGADSNSGRLYANHGREAIHFLCQLLFSLPFVPAYKGIADHMGLFGAVGYGDH